VELQAYDAASELKKRWFSDTYYDPKTGKDYTAEEAAIIKDQEETREFEERIRNGDLDVERGPWGGYFDPTKNILDDNRELPPNQAAKIEAIKLAIKAETAEVRKSLLGGYYDASNQDSDNHSLTPEEVKQILEIQENRKKEGQSSGQKRRTSNDRLLGMEGCVIDNHNGTVTKAVDQRTARIEMEHLQKLKRAGIPVPDGMRLTEDGLEMNKAGNQNLESWLRESHSEKEIRDVYAQINRINVQLRHNGLSHGDYSAYNFVINDKGKVTVIDAKPTTKPNYNETQMMDILEQRMLDALKTKQQEAQLRDMSRQGNNLHELSSVTYRFGPSDSDIDGYQD